MAIDFITDTPQTSPTEGLDLQAPEAPYVPSTAWDTADIWGNAKRAFLGIQNLSAKYGAVDPYTGNMISGPAARLSVERGKKEYPGVTGITEPLPRSVIENMQIQQKHDAVRADIDARYPAGLGAGLARLAVGAVTSLLDPVDDAAFMVPVVGEARYAGWLARAGESSGIAGRLGVTAAVGAARGAGGGAILGAGQYALDPNMTLGDVATETLQSALGGGLLHTAFGFRSDVMGHRFIESPEGKTAIQDAMVHDSASRVAAAQMAAGHPIDVRPVFDAARPRLTREELLGSTAMDRAQAVYTDDAVARAAGRPTQEDMLADDLSRQARTTTPDQVTKGQLDEIDRAIAELRGTGYLTPEEEAELAQYEPRAKPSEDEAKPSEDEAKVATAQGEEQAAQAEGQPTTKIVPMEGAEQPGGGAPNVVGEHFQPQEHEGGPPERAQNPAGWEGVEGTPRPEGRAQMLGDNIRAIVGDNATPEEAAAIKHVSDILDRIAPAAAQVATRRLEAAGDLASVGVEKGAGGTITGYTRVGPENLIAWSLESPNAGLTARHEAVHFLRHGGFLRDAEWQVLAKAAEKGRWVDEFGIPGRYRLGSSEMHAEEAIADAFARWKRTPDWVPASVRPIFEKIQALLDRLADGLRRVFGADATAGDIFSRIESGEVGRRAPEGRMEGEAAQSFGDEEMEAAAMARQRATIAMNIIKSKALIDKIDGLKMQGLSLAHGLDARIRGISEPVEGARDSTAQHQVMQQQRLMGRLVGNLDRIPGAMEAWRGRTMTSEWVRELFELNKEGGTPGITKSPLALEMAKAVRDAQEIARLNLNQSGAWVGSYDGYISKTLHNPYKIHTATFPVWRDAVLGNIDQARTFGEMTAPEREKFLANMWDALSTGVHMRADHGEDIKAVAFPGRGDIARRASSGRVLHWKDADSWKAYQEQFGEPAIEKGVLTSLHRAGRDAALMKEWGTNPNAMFETVVRKTREKYRNDHDGLAALDKALPRIREEFAHLTGEASRPQNVLWSQIRGTLMATQDITKLGNVLLAHLSTQVTKPFQLQYLGVGRWKAYRSVLENLVKDDSPEGREILEALNANAMGQYQDMMGGYEPIDSVPGSVARVRQLSMRIGGLPWMLGRQKAGTMWELSNFLGRSLDKSFDQLDMRTARGLKIYGITPAEWDVLRTAPNPERDVQGAVYLTPRAAMRADVDGLAADRLANATDAVDADRIRDEVRNNLSMKLGAYYSDAADRSTVTPGIQERAFFTRHGGRSWGPMLGQYKGWAFAAVRTMFGQAYNGSSSKSEMVTYLAELMAVGTAIGYARLAITDASKGLKPALFNDDPKHDMSLLSKAMVAGGPLGIYGDFLMGQYARAGETSSDRAEELAASVLGPGFSDIAQTYGLTKELAAVPFSDDAMHALSRAGADGERFITAHLPIVNTFYLRALSHWLFVDRLNEAADPGYLQRHQDAIKERTGQEFYLPPTQYAGAPQ